jgi:hypothetical protein
VVGRGHGSDRSPANLESRAFRDGVPPRRAEVWNAPARSGKSG